MSFMGVKCNFGVVKCDLSGIKCNVGGVRCDLSGLKCNLGGVKCAGVPDHGVRGMWLHFRLAVLPVEPPNPRERVLY